MDAIVNLTGTGFFVSIVIAATVTMATLITATSMHEPYNMKHNALVTIFTEIFAN